MQGHTLNFRREDRQSHLRVRTVDDMPREKAYPCLGKCKKVHVDGPINGGHMGFIVFIYAKCKCGWEELVGDYIHEGEAELEGRLRFMQHQIDVLARGNGGAK